MRVQLSCKWVTWTFFTTGFLTRGDTCAQYRIPVGKIVPSTNAFARVSPRNELVLLARSRLSGFLKAGGCPQKLGLRVLTEFELDRSPVKRARTH